MTEGKKLIGFEIDTELLVRLEQWIAKQRFKPRKVDVLNEAVRSFLDKHKG